MNKIFISKGSSKKGTPPSQNLGSLTLQENKSFPKNERELLSYVFLAYGSGKYTLQVKDQDGLFQAAWRGALAQKKTEKGIRILFKALKKNSLEYYLDIEQLTVPNQRKSKVLGKPKKNMPGAYKRKALKERKKMKNKS